MIHACKQIQLPTEQLTYFFFGFVTKRQQLVILLDFRSAVDGRRRRHLRSFLTRHDVVERIRQHVDADDFRRLHRSVAVQLEIVHLQYVVDGVAGEFAENRVLSIELRRRRERNEKLTLIAVGATSHRNDATM